MSLIIENLTKTYSNRVKALDNLSLKIGKGMFGLLGPNGAGKSTLMRTIATLQSPDTGSIRFNNINVIEDQISLRKTLGYLPQSFGVYPNMSADELLNYFAKLKGISDKNERKALIEKLLEITNLTDARYFAAWEVEWLGFNFDQGTEHYILPQNMKAIKEWVEGVKMVGEFSFATAEDINEAVELLELHTVQVGMFTEVPVLKKITAAPVIKEVVISPDVDEVSLKNHLESIMSTLFPLNLL